MTGKEKKVIFTLIGVMLVILLIVVIVKGGKNAKDDINLGNSNTEAEQNVEKYTTNLESGTKLNNSEEFNKNKKYKEIEISNIQFTYENERSVLLATIKNTGSTKHKLEIVKLTILGDNNQVIDEIEPLMPELEAGEEGQFNATLTGTDSVNARDFRIEEKK